MPITDDPRKPLYAAARWMSALGWTYASFGLLFTLPADRAPRMGLTGGCLLAAGALFLISGTFARRHRGWAVWLGITTALAAGAALAFLLTLLVVRTGWRDLLGMWSITGTAMALLLLAFLFVHVIIVWNLSHAFDALGAPPATATASGFEPVVVPVVPAAPRPVLPMEPNDAPPAGP